MDEIKTYVTADNQVFRTTLDIGKTDTKKYTLYHLEMAEQRVHTGKNRTLQAALNSTKALASKNQKSSKSLSKEEFDEYGISDGAFTAEQKAFITNKIKEFEATYESSTPFERETIGLMAATLLKINEVKVKMLTSDDTGYVKQIKDLREMFSKMAEDLKLRPKDKKEQDKSKGRTSLAEIVLRYEARKRSQRKEWTEKTDLMNERMEEAREDAKDPKFADGAI